MTDVKHPLNWKALYRLASEEPIFEALIELRIRIAFALLPKHVRHLAVPLLETSIGLINQAMKEGKKNISIELSLDATKD